MATRQQMNHRKSVINEIIDGQISNNIQQAKPSGTLHNLSISELDKDNHLLVATSGTTGERTRIPMVKDNLDHYKQLNGKALSIAGINEEDIALNLGAPLPHISGWVIKEGMKRVGSGTANESYEDVFGAVNLKQVLSCPAKNVTAIISLPRVALRAGESIEAAEGKPVTEIFPNLEIGIFSGDTVNNTIRSKLKELFGLNKVVEGYAASEFGFCAMGINESSQMIPMLDSFVFEVIPDGEFRKMYSGIIDIRRVEQPVIGELALTDPYREAFDFTRYIIGDKIKVCPGAHSHTKYDFPTIEFMGRSNEVLNFGGANVHENQLDDAINNVYAQSGEWAVSRKSSRDSEGIIVELYVENPDKFDIEKFKEALSKQVPSLQEAIKLGVVEKIELQNIGYHNENGEIKFNRIEL